MQGAVRADRCLPFWSRCPLGVRKGVIQCWVKRAEEVTTTEDLKKKEMRHLVAALRGNGYPTNMVKQCNARGVLHPMTRKKSKSC